MALINLGKFNNQSHVITHSSPHKMQHANVHIHCKNLFIYTKLIIAMIEHCAHLITHTYRDTFSFCGVLKADQVWTCYFYYALPNGITWNQKHPHMAWEIGKCENEGYIPILNTGISSCHIFPYATLMRSEPLQVRIRCTVGANPWCRTLNLCIKKKKNLTS